MDCLDCKHCKVINKYGLLRCDAGNWLRPNGEEKTVRLGKHEVRTLEIRWRDLFSKAKKCPSMVSLC